MPAPAPARALAASLAKTDRLLAIIENDQLEAARLFMACELLAVSSCKRAPSAVRAATDLALAMLEDAASDVDLSDWA